jgi:hypothetical protein
MRGNEPPPRHWDVSRALYVILQQGDQALYGSIFQTTKEVYVLAKVVLLSVRMLAFGGTLLPLGEMFMSPATGLLPVRHAEGIGALCVSFVVHIH